MCKQQINRKWLNRTVKSASQTGTYFEGSSPREIAHAIVEIHDMHPCYVGKLDTLITRLVIAKKYDIVNRRLVRTDNVSKAIIEQRKSTTQRMVGRRAKMMTSQRRREQGTTWLAEQLA